MLRLLHNFILYNYSILFEDNPVKVLDSPVLDSPVLDSPVKVLDSLVLDSPVKVLDSPVLDSPVLDSPVLDSPVLDSPVLDSPVLNSRPNINIRYKFTPNIKAYKPNIKAMIEINKLNNDTNKETIINNDINKEIIINNDINKEVYSNTYTKKLKKRLLYDDNYNLKKRKLYNDYQNNLTIIPYSNNDSLNFNDDTKNNEYCKFIINNLQYPSRPCFNYQTRKCTQNDNQCIFDHRLVQINECRHNNFSKCLNKTCPYVHYNYKLNYCIKNLYSKCNYLLCKDIHLTDKIKNELKKQKICFNLLHFKTCTSKNCPICIK